MAPEAQHHELFRLADKVRSALLTLQMADNSFHEDEASDALDALDDLVALVAKETESSA